MKTAMSLSKALHIFIAITTVLTFLQFTNAQVEAEEVVTVAFPCTFKYAGTNNDMSLQDINWNRGHWTDGIGNEGHGVDIGANGGTPVVDNNVPNPYMSCQGYDAFAPISGNITTYYSNCGGNTMEIADPSTGVMIRFHHLASYIKSSGQATKGEKIAVMGNTGTCTTFPHLHMEVWKNGTRLSYTSTFSSYPNQWEFSNVTSSFNKDNFDVVIDFNGDGRKEIFCNYDYSNSVNTTFGQVANATSNTCSEWQSKSPQHASFDLNRCLAIKKVKLNTDSKDDIICTYDYGNSVTSTWAQLSDSTGALKTWSERSPKHPSFDLTKCNSILVGKVNTDAYNDIFCTYNYGNSTSTWVQTTDGSKYNTWSTWSGTHSSFDLNRCVKIGIGNFNNDGLSDLYCVYAYDNAETATWVQMSNGTTKLGSAWVQWSVKSTSFDAKLCKAIEVGKVNADAFDDIICSYDYPDGTTRTWVQPSSSSNSGAAWKSLSPKHSSFDLDNCKFIGKANLNNDGKPDLICAYDYGNSTTTWVQLSTSTGTLSNWQSWNSGNTSFDLDRCESIEVANVNGDNRDDLLCIYNYGGSTNKTWVQISSSNTAGSVWKTWSPKTEGLDATRCINIK